MDWIETLVLDNLQVVLIGVAAGITAGACYWAIASNRTPTGGTSSILGGGSAVSSSHTEQQFRNVFGLMPEERRQALIQHYMQKHGCNRHEAMKIAIDARQADEDRW